MALNITTYKQRNLWGRQSDVQASDLGLEPQRNDLYMVDFDNALKNVNAVSKKNLAPVMPHYVRSCTLPEQRTKSEPIRRDSLAYNMPSWDDPLDPVKLVFLMETSSGRSSKVIQFLDTWLALTRAGRGSRANGYYEPDWLTLNSAYSIDFRFNVNLHFLRGASTTSNFVQDNTVSAVTSANQVTPTATSITAAGNALNATIGATVNNQGSSGVNSNLVLHTTYVLKNAWLAAYKISDFNYAENSLINVETTFYIDSYDVENAVGPSGLPFEIDDTTR